MRAIPAKAMNGFRQLRMSAPEAEWDSGALLLPIAYQNKRRPEVRMRIRGVIVALVRWRLLAGIACNNRSAPERGCKKICVNGHSAVEWLPTRRRDYDHQ